MQKAPILVRKPCLLAISLLAAVWSCVCTVAAESKFSWHADDTSVGLQKDGKAVWRFNFGTNLAPKPFFDPVAVAGGTSLSWNSPPDHKWHHGLWFSWKYLNGINYWEPNPDGKPEGVTSWRVVKIDSKEDFSARIELALDYRPQNAANPVLTERRIVAISAPAADGSYSMDWDLTFTAGAQNVKFDRTPLLGEPGGQTWGGYAGLSIRLAKELSDARVSATGDIGDKSENRYRFSASAADFNGKIDGGEAGVAFIDHPANPRFPTRWYAIVDPGQPFWYLNAAWIQLKPFELEAGKTVQLKYRVAVHPGRWDSQRLEAEQAKFAGASAQAQRRVLVYTKNGKGYVHDNIAASVECIRQLGQANGFTVDVTDDPGAFTDKNLAQYDVLIFSNTNNELFEKDDQKAALQNYIHKGGGFVGIHSACGSERQWPWFWGLLGGKFVRHPPLQPFVIKVRDHNHPSTANLGETWKWTDEFYYQDHLTPGLHVLLSGDRASLNDPQKDNFGEQIAGESPLAWCHVFEGGRSWYTALGHKPEHYSDPTFKQHLLGGIQWAMRDSTPNSK